MKGDRNIHDNPSGQPERSREHDASMASTEPGDMKQE